MKSLSSLELMVEMESGSPSDSTSSLTINDLSTSELEGYDGRTINRYKRLLKYAEKLSTSYAAITKDAYEVTGVSDLSFGQLRGIDHCELGMYYEMACTLAEDSESPDTRLMRVLKGIHSEMSSILSYIGESRIRLAKLAQEKAQSTKQSVTPPIMGEL